MSKNGNGEQPPPGDGVAVEKVKRTVKRKPLWLVLPVEFEDIAAESGEILHQPTRYELYECATKKEIGDLLSKLGLDVTTINPEHIKLFRADPMPLKLTTQVTLKF